MTPAPTLDSQPHQDDALAPPQMDPTTAEAWKIITAVRVRLISPEEAVERIVKMTKEEE